MAYRDDRDAARYRGRDWTIHRYTGRRLHRSRRTRRVPFAIFTSVEVLHRDRDYRVLARISTLRERQPS